MQVHNIKTMALSAVIALSLILGGGVALQAAQTGGWMGNSGPAKMGAMPAGGGSAQFVPPTLPKVVERELESDCDRFYYLLSQGVYDPVYKRCKYGNSTQDYSVNYRQAAHFYTGLAMTATVGTNAGVCASESQIIVADGATVYYCYTVQNTGNVELPLHTLVDSVAGAVFTGTAYTLVPGASVSNVDLGAFITETVSGPGARSGSWTGFSTGGVSANATASATVDVASIVLTKTVWLNPDLTQCAPSSVITRTTNPAWPRYCYTVQNTGSTTLPVHSLVDSRLGTLFSGVNIELGPGQSYFTTTASSSVTQTTSNVGTWSASVDSVVVTGVATATLNIVAP